MSQYTSQIDLIRSSLNKAQEDLDTLEGMLDEGGETPSPISPADILGWASAGRPFAEQSGYSAQAINTYTDAEDIPESGIHGTTLPTGETLRLGKVTDPKNSSRKALAFQVVRSDPLTSSGIRSELSFRKIVDMGKVYWIAVAVYIYDWGTLPSSDDALFGTQLHADDAANSGGPSIGIYTSQTGRHFKCRARYNETTNPDKAVTKWLEEYPLPFGQWLDFVLKFKLSTSGNGFLKVWMNNQQIANYSGSLGYVNSPKDYPKFGYYNWTEESMNSIPRKVLLREPHVVIDPTGDTYSLEQLTTLLG
jgi:hypothetical protein